MNQDTAPPPPASAPPPAPGRGARIGALVVAVLIVASLGLYFVGDRLTPATSQARVQAFVVPVAAEVAGKVLAVHVRDNDEVRPGQLLLEIDPEPFRIAARRAHALGIGLLSGGYGEDELESAGAYRVYQDPADLLRHLDEVGARAAE